MATAKTRSKPPVEIGVQEARANLKEILDRVQFRGERAVITRYGDRAVALVSIADLEKIEVP